MSIQLRWPLLALLVTTTLAACGAGDGGPEADSGDYRGGVLADEVRTELRKMQAVAGVNMKPMVPDHARKVAALIDEFNREQREKRMPFDPIWSASVTALRQDVRLLPGMEARDLEGFIPSHAERVDGIIEMHRRKTSR